MINPFVTSDFHIREKQTPIHLRMEGNRSYVHGFIIKTYLLIVISLISCSCNKNSNHYERLPLGEKGIYLGMDENELKKLIGNDKTPRDYNLNGNKLHYYAYSKNILSDTESYFVFDANNILVQFSFEIPCGPFPDDKFDMMLKEYEKLYGRSKRFSTGNSLQAGCRWDDERVSIKLYFENFHNFCEMAKSYELVGKYYSEP